MAHLPESQQLPPPHPRPPRVIHIRIEPKSWWGKLFASLIGIVVLATAFFLSFFLFFGAVVILALLLLFVVVKSSTAGIARGPGDRGSRAR